MRGRKGKIDDPSIDDRTSIVHTDEGRLAIFQVGDPQPGTHWQSRMRTGHLIHVESLTCRGGTPLKVRPVPGSQSNLEPMVGPGPLVGWLEQAFGGERRIFRQGRLRISG